MTASEVIQEIEKLPQEERAKVIEFARNASQQKALTPDELVRLGERMLAADNKEEAERLRQELVRGFYGEK
jgi:hypothetical protein